MILSSLALFFCVDFFLFLFTIIGVWDITWAVCISFLLGDLTTYEYGTFLLFWILDNFYLTLLCF